MKEVYHKVYGQGTLISSDGNTAKVRWTNGVTTSVPQKELSQVVNESM